MKNIIIDNICPIVSQLYAINPNSASGSRKNSTIVRQMAYPIINMAEIFPLGRAVAAYHQMSIKRTMQWRLLINHHETTCHECHFLKTYVMARNFAKIFLFGLNLEQFHKIKY